MCEKIIRSPQITEVVLKSSAVEKFQFSPGQYAILSCEDHDPRPYSIASDPGQDTLSFHIKNTGHGLSHFLSTSDLGTPVSIDCPHGSAVLQQDSIRPILAIGGGLGLAPLCPIIRAVLDQNSAHKVILFHGVKHHEDLYLDQEMKDLAHRFENFAYTGVTEIPYQAHPTGILADAVIQNLSDVSEFDIYISGAPAMVIATLQQLDCHGLNRGRVFTDTPL